MRIATSLAACLALAGCDKPVTLVDVLDRAVFATESLPIVKAVAEYFGSEDPLASGPGCAVSRPLAQGIRQARDAARDGFTTPLVFTLSYEGCGVSADILDPRHALYVDSLYIIQNALVDDRWPDRDPESYGVACNILFAIHDAGVLSIAELDEGAATQRITVVVESFEPATCIDRLNAAGLVRIAETRERASDE